MGMVVRGSLFQPITRDGIYGGISGIGRCLSLRNDHIDEASNSQHCCRDDADSRDALSAHGTLPLFFTPKLVLPASFLPRALTSTLLAHGMTLPFHRCVTRSLSSSTHPSSHHHCETSGD